MLCAATIWGDVVDYLSSGLEFGVLIPTVLWSGLVVNALTIFLQVGGIQMMGPTGAHIFLPHNHYGSLFLTTCLSEN